MRRFLPHRRGRVPAGSQPAARQDAAARRVVGVRARTRRRSGRAIAASTALAVGAALVATGAAAPPAPYRPKVWIPPQTPRAAWPYTAGQPRVGDKPAGRSVAPNAPAAVVAWPAAGTSQISVSGTPGSAPKTSPRAGVAPVRLSVAHTGHGGKTLSAADAVTAAPTAATVTVADAATARAAGVQGLIMKLSRADSAAGPGRVAVTLDYSGFASAFGEIGRAHV